MTKFKCLLLFILFFLSLGIYGQEESAFFEFRNIPWGVSRAFVKNIETEPLFEENEEGLAYEGYFLGEKALIVYLFNSDDEFYLGGYNFIEAFKEVEVKKLFSFVTIILVSAGLSAQSCCGWIPLTWDSAPQSVKNLIGNPIGFGRGTVSVSSDHFGPGSASLQFNFDTLPGTGYAAIFLKEYPHTVLSDSFLPGIATRCSNLPNIRIQIWFLSNGVYKQFLGIGEDPFWEYFWADYRIGPVIDTVVMLVVDNDNLSSGWARLDHFQYTCQGDTVVLDSMGEAGTAVEEDLEIITDSRENHSIFMRVGERIYFQTSQVILDLAGRIVYSGKEFIPESAGQYYSIDPEKKTKIIVIN